jgi:hypothetical protein
MVQLDYYENLQREQREREQAEQEARARNRTAGNWLKGILGLATFNEGVWRGATSGSTDKFLQMSADADPVEIALGVATYVAFSYAGGLGTRLGARNAKGGKLLTYNEVVENAKSKGYTIDPQLKPKVEAEINRVNNQTGIEQLKGLLKIRSDTLESIGKLLTNAKTAGERAELQKSYNETLIKLQEGGLDVQVAELNKADPARQYKRDGLSIKEDLEANVEYLNKLDPDIQFKVENDAIVRVRKQADPEVIKRNEAITEENLRIAQESTRQMNERIKKANEEAKAEDKKIDEDPDFDEKGEPDGDAVIETREKLNDDDMPDFGDEAEAKEIEAGDKETDLAGKAAAAGAGAVITTEVVEKLTRGGDDETRRRRNFELDDEPGFTNEPVKEGETGTQSIKPTKTSGGGGGGGKQYSKFDIKNTIDVSNIDNLFIETLGLCEDSYEPESAYDVDKYFIKGEFPVLFHLDGDTLYIVFRGTSRSMKSWEDGVNSISNMITDLSTWDGTGLDQKLNKYDIFKAILSEEIANFGVHGGFAKTLSKYYQEIRTEIDKYSTTVNHIVFTGHSAGGALATLCYYVYQNDRNTKDKLPVEYTVTYGSPRCIINDQNNINKFNATCPNMLRVFNINDIVSYLPFNKGSFFLKNIANGFVHVGKPFPLDSNVDENSLNALVLLVLKGQKDKYKQLIKNFTLDEIRENQIIKLITSDKYLSILSDCLFQCYSNVGVREKLPDEMITIYTQELYSNSKNILDYAEKCNLVEPLFISDILKQNQIGETPEQENIAISSIAGALMGFNQITVESHLFPKYYENIDKLVQREVKFKKSFLDPLEEEDETYIIPPVPIPVTPEKISIDLMALIEKDIESGYIQGLTNGESGNLIIYT